jgi:hypothetical protein
LAALKGRIAKARKDAKNNKGQIMQGLVNYARYGEKNPFNNVLSEEKLNALTGDELVALLHGLSNYDHRILYYGPSSLTDLTASIQKMHKIPAAFADAPKKKEFTYTTQTENNVLFANYDMVQSEIRWVRNVPGYDPSNQPIIDMFNNYFGGNMGAIVFQTIRESKALAYSTNSYYMTPAKKEDPYYIAAYVGCQADKFNESIIAMNELLNDLPSADNNLQAAKAALKKDIETDRITKDGIIFNYLSAESRGITGDIRKTIYEKADALTYADLKQFHDNNMKGKPFTYCIVASDKKLSDTDMQKYGKVKKLTLEEIFGY